MAPKHDIVGLSLHWIPKQAGWHGRYINVQRSRGLNILLLQLKDPLELFVKEREFVPGSVFLFLRNVT